MILLRTVFTRTNIAPLLKIIHILQGTKTAKPTKPAASDLPVPAEGVRNIKSMWEKGNVFSSPTTSGTPNKVSTGVLSFNVGGWILFSFFFFFCIFLVITLVHYTSSEEGVILTLFCNCPKGKSRGIRLCTTPRPE